MAFRRARHCRVGFDTESGAAAVAAVPLPDARASAPGGQHGLRRCGIITNYNCYGCTRLSLPKLTFARFSLLPIYVSLRPLRLKRPPGDDSPSPPLPARPFTSRLSLATAAPARTPPFTTRAPAFAAICFLFAAASSSFFATKRAAAFAFQSWARDNHQRTRWLSQQRANNLRCGSSPQQAPRAPHRRQSVGPAPRHRPATPEGSIPCTYTLTGHTQQRASPSQEKHMGVHLVVHLTHRPLKVRNQCLRLQRLELEVVT